MVKNADTQTCYVNVQEIRDQGLCVGCGTCFTICPTNAITICRNRKGFYVPVVNNEVCNKCRLCIKVCPGHVVDFNLMNKNVFDKLPEDDLLGSYLNCYMGYAADTRVRWAGQSGGLVTALLVFALEEGIIDGAVVTRMSRSDPLSPEVLVAESKKEILSASKSKYCSVPLNVVVKEVLKKDGKYAIVGVPCQIHGLRKLEMIKTELKKKIVLHLGLFCSHMLSFLAIDFLLHKASIRKNDLIKFEYKSKALRGWPGDVLFTLSNGAEKFLSREHRTLIVPFFTPWRCKMCYDQVNEFADISFGDAWLPEVMHCKEGTSVLISRTETGERLLQRASNEGEIKLQEISRSKIVQSQRGPLFSKKSLLGARVVISKLLGENVPEYNVKLLKPRKVKRLSAVFDYINTRIPYNSTTNLLLKHTPLSLLSLYESSILSALTTTRGENAILA